MRRWKEKYMHHFVCIAPVLLSKACRIFGTTQTITGPSLLIWVLFQQLGRCFLLSRWGFCIHCHFPFFPRIQQKRIFDTVKHANDMHGRSASCPVSLSIPGSNRSSVVMTAKPFHSGLKYVEGKGPQALKASTEDVSK